MSLLPAMRLSITGPASSSFEVVDVLNCPSFGIAKPIGMEDNTNLKNNFRIFFKGSFFTLFTCHYCTTAHFLSSLDVVTKIY